MKLLVFFLLLIQFSASATVLVIPENFRVLKVNNTEVKATLFVRETALRIKPGKQVLVLQYADMFDSARHDDHTKVRSEPFVVSFYLQQESQLTFVAPKISDLVQARQYAQAPKIEIRDEFGSALALMHSLASDIVAEEFVANEFPVEKSIPVSQSGSDNDAANTSNAPNSYEMLKFWWLNASAEEKKRFQDFIKTQKG